VAGLQHERFVEGQRSEGSGLGAVDPRGESHGFDRKRELLLRVRNH
jgi:hypothetical protein